MRKCLKVLSLLLCMQASLFAQVDLRSDEGWIEKDKSTFAGHVTLEWPSKLKIACDHAEVVKKEGIVLQARERPFLKVDLFEPSLSIRAKKGILDDEMEKLLFVDEVSLMIDEYMFKAQNAECFLEELVPQTFSLFSSKKEGCSLSSPFLDKLHFQRVDFDFLQKCAHFFLPKGEFQWNGRDVSFSANWMKVEEEGKLVLDGKIIIRVGVGVYTSNGPLVVYFDPKTVEATSIHVEGKSAFAWNDYTLQLDGLLHYEDEIIELKSPERNGIVLKYPFGQVHAERGEIALLKKDPFFEVGRVDLSGNVFATYGIPTLQYLLADAIEIELEQNLATLLSKDKSRVLIYDHINNLEMSADRVLVNWGAHKGEERIEGVGDVRFSFDQKEKGLIDALFRGR